MRYSYTSVALFALTTSALPTGTKRSPQIIGDLAHGLGSAVHGVGEGVYGLAGDVYGVATDITEPFTSAAGDVIGGVAGTAADLVGGVFSGLTGYKEKRDPQILGGLVYGAANAVGGVADVAADIIGDLTPFGYDSDYNRKSKRSPQILGSLIDTGSDVVDDVLDTLTDFEYKRQVIPAAPVEATEETEEEGNRKRSPQILGGLVYGAANAVGGVADVAADIIGDLTPFGYDSDYDRKSKRSPQILGSLIDTGSDVVDDVLDTLTDFEYKRQVVPAAPVEAAEEDEEEGNRKRSPQYGLGEFVGNVASVPGKLIGGVVSGVAHGGIDVADAFTGGIVGDLLSPFDRDDEYKVKRDAQVGELAEDLAHGFGGLLHSTGTVAYDVGKGTFKGAAAVAKGAGKTVEGLAKGVAGTGYGFLDGLVNGKDVVEKRDPQILTDVVGGLGETLTGVTDSLLGGLLGGGRDYDEEAVPEVIVVAPEIVAAAPGYKEKRDAQVVPALLNGLLGGGRGYDDYEYEHRGYEGRRHGYGDDIIVSVGAPREYDH